MTSLGNGLVSLCSVFVPVCKTTTVFISLSAKRILYFAKPSTQFAVHVFCATWHVVSKFALVYFTDRNESWCRNIPRKFVIRLPVRKECGSLALVNRPLSGRVRLSLTRRPFEVPRRGTSPLSVKNGTEPRERAGAKPIRL